MPAGDRRKRRLNTIYLYIILKLTFNDEHGLLSLNTIYLYIILKHWCNYICTCISLNTIYLYIILKQQFRQGWFS